MKIPELEELVADRNALSNFIYTPKNEAVAELARRRLESSTENQVLALVGGDVPNPFRKEPRAVLFRQLATPNHEMLRFLDITSPLGEIKPLFWEYYADKFTTQNEFKHSLGKIRIFNGVGKKGGAKIDRFNIIDFNKYDGKRMSEIKTLWEQDLISFHHELFKKTDPQLGSESFFDASSWLANHGENAGGYYTPFLSLFVRHGILFENFLTSKKEGEFTHRIFLPAFMEVIRKTGLKPLIVPLEPFASEEDEFWICYPQSSKAHFHERISAQVL